MAKARQRSGKFVDHKNRISSRLKMLPFYFPLLCYLASGLTTKVASVWCYFTALVLYPRSYYTTAMIWTAVT